MDNSSVTTAPPINTQTNQSTSNNTIDNGSSPDSYDSGNFNEEYNAGISGLAALTGDEGGNQGDDNPQEQEVNQEGELLSADYVNTTYSVEGEINTNFVNVDERPDQPRILDGGDNRAVMLNGELITIGENESATVVFEGADSTTSYNIDPDRLASSTVDAQGNTIRNMSGPTEGITYELNEEQQARLADATAKGDSAEISALFDEADSAQKTNAINDAFQTEEYTTQISNSDGNADAAEINYLIKSTGLAPVELLAQADSSLTRLEAEQNNIEPEFAQAHKNAVVTNTLLREGILTQLTTNPHDILTASLPQGDGELTPSQEVNAAQAVSDAFETGVYNFHDVPTTTAEQKELINEFVNGELTELPPEVQLAAHRDLTLVKQETMQLFPSAVPQGETAEIPEQLDFIELNGNAYADQYNQLAQFHIDNGATELPEELSNQGTVSASMPESMGEKLEVLGSLFEDIGELLTTAQMNDSLMMDQLQQGTYDSTSLISQGDLQDIFEDSGIATDNEDMNANFSEAVDNLETAFNEILSDDDIQNLFASSLEVDNTQS